MLDFKKSAKRVKKHELREISKLIPDSQPKSLMPDILPSRNVARPIQHLGERHWRGKFGFGKLFERPSA